MSKYITIIKNNKKIKYTVLVLIVAIAIIIGINYFQTTNNPDAIRKSTKISADSLKSQAIKILETNPTKAKDLFLQALKKYQTIDDKNNIVDVDAQLYMIDHAS